MYLEEQQKQDYTQTEKLKSNKSELCDICHGSGATGDGLCSSCNSKGLIWRSF
jgi:DnaJ-class molecular chaperone